MNRSHLLPRQLCVAAAIALTGTIAQAAPANDAFAAAYARDRAACLDGSSKQERGACLYEAISTLKQSRAGAVPTASAQTMADNAAQRCQVQPAGGDRSDCERMARGEGEVTGSVAAGGLLKSLTTYSVEPVATPK